MKPVRLFTAILLSLATLAPMAQAAGDPLLGTWQTAEGDARFEVRYCGEGPEICAEMIWLRDDEKTPENLQLLNTNVVWDARQTAPNRWRGMVNYKGVIVSGTITLENRNAAKVSGCKLIFCETMNLVRL